MKWLGFKINLAKTMFSVPSEKIEALKSSVNYVKSTPLVPVRQVASVISKIISMSLDLGLVTRLMTCSLYASLNTKTSIPVPKNIPDK